MSGEQENQIEEGGLNVDVKRYPECFDALFGLGLNVRLGYAGSYARGKAKINSDLDIVVEGKRTLSSDEYFAIYNKLKQLLKIKFDIVDLVALEEDDAKMDDMLLNMGLEANESSAYKTMKKEAIWMN